MKALVRAALFGAIAFAAPAHAVLVVSGNGTLSSTDPVQTPRVFRDGNASTWAAPKAFPGTTGSGNYVYDLVNGTFGANANQAVYYEITYTSDSDPNAVSQPFSVAYLNSFDPNNIGANYLGDSGVSVNSASSATYQVIVPTGGQLLVNFSEVVQGNLPTNYSFTINAYSDANRNENFGVPEPATWALMLGGFGLMGAALRRRSKTASALA